MVDLFTKGPRSLRRSPLQHLTEELAAAAVSGPRGAVLKEIAFLTQIGLRAEPGSPAYEALAEATGVGLPARVGEVAGSQENVAVLWLAPDEFLVVTAPDQHDLLRALTEALGEHPGQVVDLSANRAVVEISGGSAREALEKGVPADLHPRAFPVGTAVTTALGPVQILLWHTAEDEYRVLPRASFADYTAHWLIDTIREYRTSAVV